MAGAKFKCSNCGFEKDVPSQYAGKRVRCPKCQAESRVSEVPSRSPAPSPAVPRIKFNCPICDQKIGVPAQHAGKRVLCPGCKNPATVPMPAGPAAPKAPKSPDQILRVGEQQADDGELRLQPLGDADELLRMERDSAATERTTGPVAAVPGNTDAYSYDVPSRAHRVSQGKSRKGLTPFIVIGSVYLIAILLAIGGVVALLRPMPEPEAVDIAPAQKLADRCIRLLADRNTGEVRKLASEALRKKLDDKTLADLAVFVGAGKFEFDEEWHCVLEEGGQLGILLTYTDKSSGSGKALEAGSEQAIAVTEPNSEEQDVNDVSSQDEQADAIVAEAEPNIAGSAPERSADDEESTDDEESVDSERSIDIILAKTESGYVVESISTTGVRLQDFVSAESELGEKISTEILVSAVSVLGKHMLTVIYWLAPAVIMVSIVLVVCMWIVYSKAGQPGWASIVPVYNMWVLAEIADKPGWLGLVVIFSGCIPYVGQFAGIAIMIVISIGVAKAFDKGILFGLGLWLVPWIFYPILAFSD